MGRNREAGHVGCWMWCIQYSTDDHADEDYNEINGHIYASVVYLMLSVFLCCFC